MTNKGDQQNASCFDAVFIAFMVSALISIAAFVAGVSSDYRYVIIFGSTAILSPIVFMILSARREREWLKKWQGPAHMYRAVPPTPTRVAGGVMVEDRGYLERLIPGYRYQFADEPSGRLLRDFVLLGTWDGIITFMENNRKRMIENNSSIPGAGIYMAIKSYRPKERYKTSHGRSTYILQVLVDLVSLFAPGGNQVTDLAETAGELNQAVKEIRGESTKEKKRPPKFSRRSVLAIHFSVLKRDKDYLFIADQSVDFGSIRRILERTD